MSGLLDAAAARFDGLSRRERWIVLIGVGLLAAGIGDGLLLQPLDARLQALTDRRDQLEQRAQTLAEAQATLEEQLEGSTGPPSGPAQDLRTAIDGVDAKITARAALFVPPAEMMPLLEAVLERQPGVKLEEIEALEPVGLLESEVAPSGLQPATSVAQIYRHGMRISVEASYLDTVLFLQRLESLPWALFWESLDYEVTTWPRARVRLLVHTLSTAEQWRDA